MKEVRKELEKSEIWKFKWKECFKKLIIIVKCDRLIGKEIKVIGDLYKYKMMFFKRIL